MRRTFLISLLVMYLPGKLSGTLLLIAVVLVVYTNALLGGVFQFDDYNVIVNNAVVHSWRSWWSDVGRGIRPLLKLSYTFDWMLGDWVYSRRETSFHLTNLLIHSGNTILVWLLTMSFMRYTDRTISLAMSISIVTALLFAVHPIHTEAVTYISGRSTSLMTLFYLGGMLSYLAGRQRQNRFYLRVVTPLLFIAALAVKEVAVTFPLALLLIHFASGGTWRSSITQAWSNWLVLAAGIILFFMDTNYSHHLARSLAIHDGWSNLAVQANATIYLLGQWLCPLWLNIDPDLTGLNATSKLNLGLICTIIIASFILVKRLKQRPWLAFALGWVMIHLFLVYLIAPRLDIANERQLYLVSWPLLMALVAEMAIFFTSRQFILVSFVLLILASMLTIMRNLDYCSEVALWQATAKLSPNKARVHNNLGYAYFLADQPDKARQHYLKALALDNHNFKASYNLEILNNVKK